MDLDTLDHDHHVRRAITLSREAGERGDPPYGSLLVRDGDVVMEERNREATDDDLALHPELTLARRAAREFSAAERQSTVMYTSTEPCPMCAAGTAYAGLGGVVYSVPSSAGEGTGIPCEEVFDRLGHDAPVVGPLQEDEGRAVRSEFR